MKESGVEWLGRIPKNWDVKKGKQLFRETNERSVTGEEELKEMLLLIQCGCGKVR